LNNLLVKKLNFKENNGSIVGAVAIMNIVLAVLALLKDVLLTSYLGTSEIADAFALAFFITDMIGNNLLGNAAATSFIPLFSRKYVKDNIRDLNNSFITTNIFIILLAIFISIFTFMSEKIIVGFLGYGFITSTQQLSIGLIRIFIPTIILYPIISTGISMLQVLGKYILASIVPILYNFIFLLGVIFCTVLSIPPDKGVKYISFSVLIATMLMLLYIYIVLLKNRYFKFSAIDLKCIIEEVPQTLNGLKLFFTYLCILFSTQFVLYIERYLSSLFGAGSMAAQSYAYRLSQFPVWVFTSAISTVTFPLMSKAKELGDHSKATQILKQSIYTMLIITIPVVIILYTLRVPIISILFFRGAFNYKSLSITSVILAGYSTAIITQSISLLCLKYYLANRRLLIPFITFFISAIINILIDFLLVKKIGLVVLGYGTAFSGLLCSLIFLYDLKIELISDLKKGFKLLIKLLIVNMSLLIISIGYKYFWEVYFQSGSIYSKGLYVIIVSISCIGMYLGGLKYSKVIK